MSFETEEDVEQYTERRLKPLNTFGLKPCKLQTKSGVIEVDENGTISVVDMPKMQRKLAISQNGYKVNIQ